MLTEAPSNVVVPPDETETVFWQRDEGVELRCDSQSLGTVNSRCVTKRGRGLPRRTWASAGRSQRDRRRGILTNSTGRGRSAKLMKKGGECQSGPHFVRMASRTAERVLPEHILLFPFRR